MAYNQMSIMDLNDSLLTNVFSFLPYLDKIRIERVCKRWRTLSKSTQSVKLLGFAEIWEFILVEKGQTMKVNLDILKKALVPCQNTIVNIGCINCEERGGLVVKTDRKLFTLLKDFCPNLHIIVLSGIDLSAAQIKSLADNLGGQITEMKIDVRKCSSGDSFSYLFTKTLKLKTIIFTDVTEFRFTEKCLLNLPHKTLEEFHLYGNFFTDPKVDDFCKILPLFDKLHTVNLMNCFRFEYLIVYGINCNTHIAQQMKSLSITNVGIPDFNKITLAPFGSFENFTNLETLKLDRNEIVNDKLLADISQYCKNLQDVFFYDSNKVTDVGMQGLLTSLPKLEKLYLYNLSNITDKAFEDAVNLKDLKLTKCKNVKKNGILRLLSKDSKLNTLKIDSCNNIEPNEFLKKAMKIFQNRQSSQVLRLYLPKDKVKNVKDFLPHLQLFLF